MAEELLLSCIFGVSAFLIVFGFIGFVRYLRYKEVLTLAEKGLVYPERRRNGKDTLRWGILIAALGLALIIGLAPVVWRANLWPVMLVGLLPTFFGLALVLVYVVTREEEPENDIPAELEPLTSEPGEGEME